MSQNRLALATWIREFTQALTADPQGILDHLSDEPPASEVRLIYSPKFSEVEDLAAEKSDGDFLSSNRASAQPSGPSLHPAKAAEKTGKKVLPPKESPGTSFSYPANFRCTLCEDRMYPVRQFYREGRLPVLVAHHNGGFLGGTVKRDLSERFVFGGAKEDELFSRMIGAVGKKMEDFYFQEYLACHFNPERSIDEDWTRRGQNCLNHLKDTIEHKNIRLLILTGPAAIILLSDEIAKKYSEFGEPLLLPLGPGGQNISVLVIRSPAALLALEAKRKAARAAEDEAAYQKFLFMEKKIKTQILSSLKRVLSNGEFFV